MVMETYYRKRSKKANKPTVEMDYQKETVQSSINAAETPVLEPLHHVPPSPSSHRCTLLLQDTHFSFPEDDGDKSEMENHIKPGYLYEIDHDHLPPRTPVQLRSIRVAMVCEKTEVNVTVRFPSMESLNAFFNFSKRQTHPDLDEKFVMGSALAAKVLIRLVPEEIFAEQKSLVAFWLISLTADHLCKDNVVVTQKKGSCLSEALKGNGMVRWGIRRQVKYLGRHKESDGNDVNAQNSSSSFVNGLLEGSEMELEATFDERESVEEEKDGDADDGGFDCVMNDVGERDESREEKDEGDEEGEEEEENEEEEEEDEEEENKIKETNKNLKRKRYCFRNLGGRKRKKGKLEMIRKQKQTQKKNQIKKKKTRTRSKEALIQRDPKDRWSKERYKLAEQNLLAVMKSKGASMEKPILRPQLRAEARKKIGDTGLLDHLLKHMAGKLAPGGQERFRRRHNPDGAMEYWLESADLVNIRRDAGVTDPYWVPPPGWKPGDPPTQDPICARELKLLKDEVSKIKRDLELMATKVQLEEEVGRLRRELGEISSKKRQEENHAITFVASSHSDISQKLDLLVTSLESSKCDLGGAQVSVEKYKEKLMAISDFVKEVEGKIGKLTPNVAERAARTDSSLMVPTDGIHTKEKKAVEGESNSTRQEVQALIAAERETSELGKDEKKGPNIAAAEREKIGAAEAEEKAAKIKRLKSGFRICKPQGTFLWPNMVKDNSNTTIINSSSSSNKLMSPQVFVHVEVPTPPSVSSATTTAPQLIFPDNYHHHHHHHYQSSAAASLVKPLAEKRAVTVTVSTLSKGPNYEVDGANNYSTTTPLVNLNDAPTDLDARPLQLSASANTRAWESDAAYGLRNAMSYDQREYINTCCCSSSATSLPSEVGNWLALSSHKSASDDSSHG